jgi:hypothetical protein
MLGFPLEQRVHPITINDVRRTPTMSQIDTIFTLIAQKHLRIDTLETRHSDRLDFHDVAVWSVRDALEAAFKAGVEVGMNVSRPSEQDIASAD